MPVMLTVMWLIVRRCLIDSVPDLPGINSIYQRLLPSLDRKGFQVHNVTIAIVSSWGEGTNYERRRWVQRQLMCKRQR